MPITAKFSADFAQFVSAVNQADTRLRDFQSGAKDVERSLTRVGDAFSGRKILQEATLAAKAVEDIGGVTKLTEAEQKRLNATVTEALAKYKALGLEAPKSLIDIEEATEGATEAGGGMLGWLSRAGSDVLKMAAGFFTAQAAFAAVKGAIGLAVDELKILTVHGAAVADVTDNFEHLTAQSGRLGSTLLSTLRQGTHATISDFDLMKVATQDLAAGLNLTDAQFGTLAQGAFALAQATGGDVATALDTMNEAMLTGRTRSLALLTGKIDLEKAETAFARSLGTTRENLSEEGKLEAARIAILQSVEQAVERLGVQTDGLDERIAQARASWANFQDELGRTVASSPVIAAALDSIADELSRAFGTERQDLIRTIADLIDDAAISLAEFAKVGVQASGFLIKEYYALQKLWGNLAQIIDGVTLAVLNLHQAVLAKPALFGIDAATAAYQKNDEAILKLMTTMSERGKALQEMDRAQAAVNTTSDRFTQVLDGLVANMKKAQGQGRQFGPTLDELGTAAKTGTTEVGRLGPAVTALGTSAQGASAGMGNLATRTGDFIKQGGPATKAAEKLTKDVADFEASLRRVGTVGDQLKHTVARFNELEEITDKLRVSAAAFSSELLKVPRFVPENVFPRDVWAEEFNFQQKAWETHWKTIREIANQAGLKQMAKDARVAIDELVPKITTWETRIKSLSRSFEQLANIAGGSLSGVTRWIGTVTGALDVALKSSDQFQLGQQQWKDGSRLEGISSMASGVMGIAAAFSAATASGSKFQATLGGAALGAELGAKFGGAWGAAVGAAIGGIAGFIRAAFGPSAAELAGRSAAAEFRSQLESTLSVTQRLEAGTNAWAKSFIPLRDALLGVGQTHEQALEFSRRLWEAEKLGPEAVAAVIREISTILTAEFLPEHERATAIAALGWQGVLDLLMNYKDGVTDTAATARSAFESIVDPLDKLQAQIGNLDAIQRLEEAFDEFRRGGEFSFASVLSEFDRLRDSLGDAHPIIQALQEALVLAAQTGVFEWEVFAELFRSLKAEMGAGINIPISISGNRSSSGTGTGGTSAAGVDENFIQAHLPGIDFEGGQYVGREGDEYLEGLADWLNENVGDEESAERRFGTRSEWERRHLGGWIGNLPRAHRGLWMDEVPVIAQTGERVLSRSEVDRMGGRQAVDASAAGGGQSDPALLAEIAGLRAELEQRDRMLPTHLQIAIRDAVQLGTRR